MAESRPVIDSLRLSTDVYQSPSSIGGYIPHMYRHVYVDALTGRFSIDKETESESADANHPSTLLGLTFDGEVGSAYLPQQNIGIVRQGADVHGLVESGIWGVMMLAEPEPDGLGIDDGSLWSLLAHGSVRDQLEPVNDVPCHVVDASLEGIRYATVWLDVERGLLPMKRVGYGRDGAPNSTITVDSATFVEAAQLWVPESWQSDIVAAGQTLRTQTVVQADSIEFNPPVADDAFHMRFPPGTIVTDDIAGIMYEVSDDGGIGEVFYQRSGDQWEPTPSVGTDGADGFERVPPPPDLPALAKRIESAPRSPFDAHRPDAAPSAPARDPVSKPDSARNVPPEAALQPAAGPAKQDSAPEPATDVARTQSWKANRPAGAQGQPTRSAWPWWLGAAVVATLAVIAYSSLRRSGV